MRFVSIFALLVAAVPAAAETLGPPTDQFALNWSTPLTSQFSPWDKAPNARMVTAKPGAIPADAMEDALLSSANVDGRSDLAIEEMANAFEPAQRMALEDLRDAQRAYAFSDGGDRTVRNAQFAAQLHDLVEGRGRSVAHDGADESHSSDAADANDPTWIGYRDAFARFAQAMDRPDAVVGLRDDLARRRADELRAATVK